MFLFPVFREPQKGSLCNCLKFNCFYTDTKIECENSTKNGLKKDLMVFFSAMIPKLLQSGAGVLSEEAAKIGRIVESELKSNLFS